MGKNCNKIKYSCGGESLYSTCINHEGILPEFSELSDCVSLEDTTTELYTFVGEIRDQIDLSALGEKCLSYTKVEGKIFVKEALLKFEEKICELQERIETLENRQLCDIPIAECLEDFSCLEAPCDGTILTLKDWMLAVQTKICE